MRRLSARTSVRVRFQGWRAAAGPLTAGQRNIARWLVVAPHTPAAMLDQVFDVPPGTALHDVVEVLGVLLCRHEGLRSRFHLEHPGEQRVLDAGELSVAVREAEPHDDPAAVAAGLLALCRETPIDVRAESPVRFAVAVHGDVVVSAVALYSHLAVDFQALAVLAAQFEEMLRDPAARVIGGPRQQPLDRTAVERQPGRVRRMEQALRHWDRVLQAAPAHLYARPRSGAGAGDCAAGGSGACGISSEAAAQALRTIAARLQISRPTIVLAAWCALLARRTGYDTCRFVMLSANRFESSLAGYVGTLAQSTFVAVEVAGAGFDDLVRRCFGAVLQAGLHGAYDVHRQHERSAAITSARGIAPTFEPMFNSIVIDGPQPRAVAAPHEPAPTRVSWVDLPPTDILLRFDLGMLDEAMVARVWTGDTARVTPQETETLLRALERLLVAAAAGDLDPAAIVAALDLPPLPRPPGWHLVDHCWIDLADVQRLLDAALAPAVCRVRVEGEELVAVVAGFPGGVAEARRRCLAALPGRHAAMVPQRFLLT